MKINDESIVFLNKQISLIKKGWYLYLPIALAVALFAFFSRYKPETIYLDIILILFSMGTIYLFGFLINSLKRLEIINHIVKTVYFNEDEVSLTTYTALWKKEITINIPYSGLQLKKGANEKFANLLGYNSSYRIIVLSTGQVFYISAAMFTEKEVLEKLLQNKILMQ